MSARGLGIPDFWSIVKLTPTVTLQWLFITVVDALPRPLKRMLLARRLSGPRLERRLKGHAAGGLRMFKALLRMAHVSSNPSAQIGQRIPRCTVYEGGLPIDLSNWQPSGGSSSVPLVLNFGSCS
jgi:hypothetical protein